MQILIIAIGSRGDIQPYIALGQGLQRAGHGVRVVTNDEFAPLVASYGLEMCGVDIGAQAAFQQPGASAAIERGGVITSFVKLASLARTRSRHVFEVALRASAGYDVLLAGLGGLFTAASLAEKLGRPFVQAYNVPLTPTAAYPGALFPWMSFPPRPAWHRLSHILTRQMVWQTGRMAANATRTEVLGLAPAPAARVFDRGIFKGAPVLYGISPAVLPKPADWGERIHVTGFWFADEPPGWTPPADLVEFIQRGPAPVYVGFGSMSTENPEATTRLVLDAVAAAGCRAVISAGWAGLGSASASAAAGENVHFAGSVPHAWLFPQMAAIVHHGGAGTTAAAFRAGVPSVVVPFHGDQPFWGSVTEQLGVGTRPVPRRGLTAERLAAAIKQAVTSDGLRQRAAALGERVRREDGVGTAVALIESAAPRG